MEITKKKIKRKSIFDNQRYINEEMLKFIVYNIEKFEIKCKTNEISITSDVFYKKIKEILQEHQEDCFLKIQSHLDIKKIYKDDKAKLINDYKKMYTIILETKIEDS